MPFRSKSQERWMFSNKPEMAKRWAKETPDINALPNKVKKKKVYKIKIDNKLKGAYGETDTTKKVIKINKKLHKDKKYKRVKANKDGTESLRNTIKHEKLHAKYPSLSEKAVRSKVK